MIRRIILLAGLASLILATQACATPAPAQPTAATLPTATSGPVTQVTVLVVTPPNQPTLQVATPLPQDTSTPQAAEPTAAPATSSPSLPTPTPLNLLTARIEGDTNKIDGTIFWPDTGGPASTSLVFWAEARDPEVGQAYGSGILSIDFVIKDSDGQTVYSNTVNKPVYCVFGGGDPDCTEFVFADNNYQWPGTNLPVQNGDFTLTATVNAQDGSKWSGSASFSIQLP